MSSPITIVIPAYNRAHTLPRTLASVESQVVPPSKVVLVDNSSSDTTLAVMSDWAAKTHPFEVMVVSEPKRGACAARNRGLREVETEFVMFFDSDDEMLPCHVGDFAAAIRENPQTDIFGRNIITESIDGSRRTLYYTACNPMFNHIFRGCLSTQRIVVRTSLVRQVGGWNEELPVWNDFELGVRLLLATDRLCALSGTPSVITYQQAESITGTSFGSKAGQWEDVLNRIEALLESAGELDSVKWIDCRRMILAAQYYREGNRDIALVLKEAVCRNNNKSWRLKMIYRHNVIFGRLTWLIAKYLL